MQIPVPLPRCLLRAKNTFVDWLNVPVYGRGRIAVLRVDIMSAIIVAGCTAWYAAMVGWGAGLAACFVSVAMWATVLYFKNSDIGAGRP